MIHYRILNNESPPTKPTRSLKVARSQMTEGSKIFAFASRKDALALSPARLEVPDNHKAPRQLTAENLMVFVQAHRDAKAIHPKHPPSSASSRRQMEDRYAHHLFGFTKDGRAIDAQQFMSVSCNWVRYSCPIYINGRKSTIRMIEKGLKPWSSILHALSIAETGS